MKQKKSDKEKFSPNWAGLGFEGEIRKISEKLTRRKQYDPSVIMQKS